MITKLLTNSHRLKITLSLSLFLLFHLNLSAQYQQWAWIGGDSIANLNGVYGTKGVSSSSNKLGGRHSAANWKDNLGNFWLYGGFGYDSAGGTTGILSDLWKYNPSTSEWTWMNGSNALNETPIYGTQGVAAPYNKPGKRVFSLSCVDTNGNFWLFGGGDGWGGEINDLWKYDPTTNLWTWMKGDSTWGSFGIYGTKGVANPANTPGARTMAAFHADKYGNLWLFGGDGNDANSSSQSLNDIWKYNTTTNEWTWVHGDSLGSQLGTYGSKGLASSSNKISSRWGMGNWMNRTTDEFWIMGGYGYEYSATQGVLNDLWKFNLITHEWTWVNGDSIINQSTVRGTKGISSPLNKLGGQILPISWIDTLGNLWSFGGMVISSAFGYSNELWKYNVTTNEWTWASGDSLVFSPAVFGTKGVYAAANTPESRFRSNGWIDNKGDLWLFGGNGWNSSASQNLHFGDLWRFKTGNKWTGNTNTNWSTNTNWENGVVPANNEDIIIPSLSVVNEPTISTNGISIRSLDLQAGRVLTLNGSSLSITNNLLNNGLVKGNALSDAVEMNGSTTQTISGNGAIDNLTINNSTNVDTGSLNKLKINGIVLVNNTQVLTTNDNLILGSTANGTAMYGNGIGTISGNVTVERYIGAPTAKRAWRLLSPPYQNVSVANNWQNDFDGDNSVTTPGVGTNITNPTNVNGSDYQSVDFSLKKYNPATQLLEGVNNINTELVDPFQNAAFLFVRGDRNIGKSGTNNTTLKTVHPLYNTGQIISLGTVNANEFYLVGNPHASPVDFNQTGLIGLHKRFYSWDPNLGSLGGYVTVDDVDGDGTYTISPSTGTAQTQLIQSGQAIYLQKDNTTGTGSISFPLSSKSTGVVNNVFKTTSSNETINTMLYEVDTNKKAIAIDGATIIRKVTYSNNIDDLDALKRENITEGFGIINNSKVLSIERRGLLSNVKDTVQFQFVKTQLKNYRLTLEVSNFTSSPNVYLVDAFTQTATSLNTSGSTDYDFTVTSANGSWDAKRFYLVYSLSNPLWLNPTNRKEQSLTIYPNPIENHQLQIQANNMEAGNYQLSVVNVKGEIVYQDAMPLAPSKTTHQIALPKSLATGMYHLRFIKGNSSFEQQFMIK